MTLSIKHNEFGCKKIGKQLTGAGAGGFQGFTGAGGAGIFDEIFETFGDVFGGGRGRGGQAYARPGADLRFSLDLTLEDAVLGRTEQISVPTWVACKDCSGSGAKKGSKPTTCKDCGGAGQVRMQQGFFSVQQTCPTCRGTGQMISDPCTRCYGQGRVQQEKKLSVKIPAGVDTGDRIRLSGEGEAGIHGAPAGDLYVQVNVLPHNLFIREGNDLHCEIPIDFVTAAIGGEVDAPTLHGRVKLKIPAETQTGKAFRLRGKGVKSVRSRATGDLICHAVIETPINLTSEQKTLLQQLQTSLNINRDKHSPRARSWLSRVKSFFEKI